MVRVKALRRSGRFSVIVAILDVTSRRISSLMCGLSRQPRPAATMAGQSTAPPPRAASAPSTCHQWASLPYSSRQAQSRLVQWCRSCSAV